MLRNYPRPGKRVRTLTELRSGDVVFKSGTEGEILDGPPKRDIEGPGDKFKIRIINYDFIMQRDQLEDVD